MDKAQLETRVKIPQQEPDRLILTLIISFLCRRCCIIKSLFELGLKKSEKNIFCFDEFDRKLIKGSRRRSRNMSQSFFVEKSFICV